MGKIYSNQPFAIELSYTELPGTVESVAIKYRNPNGRSGSFAATHDAQNKKISYTSIAEETLKYAGTWRFWAQVTLTSGAVYPGEPVVAVIYKEGE